MQGRAASCLPPAASALLSAARTPAPIRTQSLTLTLRLCRTHVGTVASSKGALQQPRPLAAGAPLGNGQVWGLAKGRASKKAKAKLQQMQQRPAREDDASSLRAGVQVTVFECPSPMQFTALSSVALLQIAGWGWMIGSNVLGYSTGSTFIVSNWWCAFGLALSSAMATMTYWHAGHHLVRLIVKPGLVDELLITTHTMIGGERTRTATRFDVVPNKLALQVCSNLALPKRSRVCCRRMRW